MISKIYGNNIPKGLNILKFILPTEGAQVLEEHVGYAAEQIDMVISLDVGLRGVIGKLYSFAREKTSLPLCLNAAKILEDELETGRVVFLATGWPDRPHITSEIAESDGPPGTAVLARALHVGFNAVPIILTEEQLVSGISKVVQAAGFRILKPDEAIKSASSRAPIHGAAVIGFPKDKSAAEDKSRELIEKYDPVAVITVERGGMNDRGVIHTSRGDDTTDALAKVDYLVTEAKARGIVTIGIGDGGNEIGMGLIKEEIKRSIPYGAECRCGCGGGIAPETATDALVTAAVSNWGAYGIAACLSVLSENTEIFHNEAIEERILRESANASFIDGITGYVDPSADGLPLQVNVSIVRILREIVVKSLGKLGKLDSG